MLFYHLFNGLWVFLFNSLIQSLAFIIRYYKSDNFGLDWGKRHLRFPITVKVRRGELTFLWRAFRMCFLMTVLVLFSWITLCLWTLRAIERASPWIWVKIRVNLVPTVKKPLFFEKPVVAENFQGVLLEVFLRRNFVYALILNIVHFSSGVTTFDLCDSGRGQFFRKFPRLSEKLPVLFRCWQGKG